MPCDVYVCMYKCGSMHLCVACGCDGSFLDCQLHFCKSLPLRMNGNLPAGIGMHVFAMICDLIHVLGGTCLLYVSKGKPSS